MKPGEFGKAMDELGYLPYQVQILKKFLKYLQESIEQIEENIEFRIEAKEEGDDDENDL